MENFVLKFKLLFNNLNTISKWKIKIHKHQTKIIIWKIYYTKLQFIETTALSTSNIFIIHWMYDKIFQHVKFIFEYIKYTRFTTNKTWRSTNETVQQQNTNSLMLSSHSVLYNAHNINLILTKKFVHILFQLLKALFILWWLHVVFWCYIDSGQINISWNLLVCF